MLSLPQEGPCRDQRLRLTLPADMAQVRHAMVLLHRFWIRAGMDVASTEKAGLVLAEVLNNVVEHACSDDPAALVWLDISRCAGVLDIVVTDSGRPIPDARLPDATMPGIPREIENLPEGGFGWPLIWRLARSVTYQRVGGWNRLHLELQCFPGAGTKPDVQGNAAIF